MFGVEAAARQGAGREPSFLFRAGSHIADEGNRGHPIEPWVVPRRAILRADLPRFGICTKPDNAVKVGSCLEQAERDPCASAGGAGAACNCRRVPISARLGTVKDEFAYHPSPSFSSGPRFGGGLCAVDCARVEPDGHQHQILRPRRPRSALGDDPGSSRPAAAHIGVSIRRSAVWPGRSFNRGRRHRPWLWPRRRGSQDHRVVGAEDLVWTSRFAAQTVRGAARGSAGRSCFDVWSLTSPLSA